MNTDDDKKIVEDTPIVSKENIINALLKAPNQIADTIAEQKDICKASLQLLLVGIICHAIFGAAIGLFAGFSVALMDLVKAPMVAVCSLLVCFPSLYIFTCVAGSPLTMRQTFALGCSCIAMVGFLLIGLAPVAWLFAVSTNNMPFIVILTFLIWVIAMIFAARYFNKLKSNDLFKKQAGINVWFIILIVVTLQMTTCMRPMLSKPEKGWFTPEKQFFLSHFGSTFTQDKDKPRSY